MKMSIKRSQEEFCRVCRNSCPDGLLCGSCGDLFHYRCAKLTAADFKYFQRAIIDYMCAECRRPRGMSACLKALNRLNCCDSRLIKEVAIREETFLEYEAFEVSFFVTVYNVIIL